MLVKGASVLFGTTIFLAQCVEESLQGTIKINVYEHGEDIKIIWNGKVDTSGLPEPQIPNVTPGPLALSDNENQKFFVNGQNSSVSNYKFGSNGDTDEVIVNYSDLGSWEELDPIGGYGEIVGFHYDIIHQNGGIVLPAEYAGEIIRGELTIPGQTFTSLGVIDMAASNVTWTSSKNTTETIRVQTIARLEEICQARCRSRTKCTSKCMSQIKI